jgi:hypothetical protein
MTIIKASCSTCGDVELAPADVRLVVSSVADRSFYAFTCPVCTERVRKDASQEVVRLLTAGGLRAEQVVVPAEALEQHPPTVMTWDEVLDFGSWIEQCGDIVAEAQRWSVPQAARRTTDTYLGRGLDSR